MKIDPIVKKKQVIVKLKKQNLVFKQNLIQRVRAVFETNKIYSRNYTHTYISYTRIAKLIILGRYYYHYGSNYATYY